MPRRTDMSAARQPQPGSRFLSEVLADNLRDLRTLNRLSQREVAERMKWLQHEGWSQTTVSEVERGQRNVTTDELLALALIYGRTIGELLDPGGVLGDKHPTIDYGGREPASAHVARAWVRDAVRIKLHRNNDGEWDFEITPISPFIPQPPSDMEVVT